MKEIKLLQLLALVGAAFLVAMPQPAEAIPAFARATKLNCEACHSAFPALNQTGRQFKTNGYRLDPVSEGTGPSVFADSVSSFPGSMVLVSRPFTKDKGANYEVRAIHEAELIAGGVLYQKLSGFVEFEAEGEDGFGSVFAHGAVNYDANDAVHLQIAYAPTFFADPYDTLSEMRSLTAAHYAMFNSTFGHADNDGVMRHSRQQVSLFGRVGDGRLFYNVGFGGLTEDLIANESTVAFGRVAYDITPDVMIGGFGLSGTCKVKMVSDFADCGGSTTDMDFSRYGVDAQADVGQVRIAGVYLSAKDDMPSGAGSETNNNAYVQFTYFGSTGNNMAVPLLRIENTQSNDGNDKVTRVTLGASYYFQKNFKASLEFGRDTKVPTGQTKGNNVTIQLVAAF
jgi:hypothetical protein